MADLKYYDYINAFYELLQVNPPSANAQLLYHTLLMIFNRALWVSELQRTNSYVCGLCGLGEKALINAKNELKQIGLIDFISPKKKPTIYKLLTVKSTVKNTVQTQVKGKSNDSPNASQRKVNVQSKVQSYKDIRHKTKDIRVEEVKEDTAAAALKDVVLCYEENIGTVSSILADNMADWLKDVEPDVIKFAIGEAVKHEKRNWKYIEAIIKNHFNSGRTTVAAIKAAQRTFTKHPDKDTGVYKNDGYNYSEIEKLMQRSDGQ